MSIPTVVINEGNPSGTSKIREGDNRIIEYKVQNREILEVDHQYPSSGQDADNGKHKQISLLEQADLGTGAVGKPIFGAQTLNGKAEAVFTDEEDRDVVITKDGAVMGIPTGVVVDWGGTIVAIPTGYLFCNGAAVSRTTYAALFTAIAEIHGVGDGSTTFNLPDLRDFSVVGAKEDDGGVPKSNISGALTVTGGTATHALSIAELAAHTHLTVKNATSSSALSALNAFARAYSTSADEAYDGKGSATPADYGLSSSTGSDTAHNNLHPYKVMVKVIKT